MYGPHTTLRQMAREPSPGLAAIVRGRNAPPAKNALRLTPKDILSTTKVTLGWLLHQVGRGEIEPHDAAWSLCPDTDCMFSGLVKLIGHSEMTLRSWAEFYREQGPDTEKENEIRAELLKIWGRKDILCRLPQKKQD